MSPSLCLLFQLVKKQYGLEKSEPTLEKNETHKIIKLTMKKRYLYWVPQVLHILKIPQNIDRNAYFHSNASNKVEFCINEPQQGVEIFLDIWHVG